MLCLDESPPDDWAATFMLESMRLNPPGARMTFSNTLSFAVAMSRGVNALLLVAVTRSAVFCDELEELLLDELEELLLDDESDESLLLEELEELATQTMSYRSNET